MNRMMAFVAFSVLVGCGAGKKNVAACEDYVASLGCGEFDFSTIYGDGFCDAYGETKCNVADYFTCLTDGSTCDEETGIFTPAVDCTIPTC